MRSNNPIVRACLLKELFQLFWDSDDPELARTHMLDWIRKAKRTRLTPFKVFVQLLEGHLEGILAWTNLRLSNGALEGMNNKTKLVSHRGFGFRSATNFIAAICHSCSNLPLPDWR